MLEKYGAVIGIVSALAWPVAATTGSTASKPGPYTMKGKVTAVTAKDGAKCETVDAPLTGGAILFPPENKLAVGIQPDAAVTDGIMYLFGFGSENPAVNVQYVFPALAILNAHGTYVISNAVTKSKSFSFKLVTTTGSQDGSAGGSCKTTYTMSFNYGLPTNLKTLVTTLMTFSH